MRLFNNEPRERAHSAKQPARPASAAEAPRKLSRSKLLILQEKERAENARPTFRF